MLADSSTATRRRGRSTTTTTENQTPKVWRESKIIAILIPRKDSANMYKLYERLILNKMEPSVDRHLIREQACFRPGKSCCSQLLNLTQHIEVGYHRLITGAAFVDLSAAYDAVNHRLIIRKLYDFTQDTM